MFTKVNSMFFAIALVALAFNISTVKAVEVSVETEASYVLCHDGIDNDDNGSTDMADSNCANFATNPEVPQTPVKEDSSNRSSSRGGQKKLTPSTRSGEVLGASTDDSCKILTTYIKIGQNNNVDDVKFLQSFLNTELGINLPVTGFYGALTLKAVNDFQLKYSDDVLKPWIDLGLHSSEEIATGYVYKTTQHTINTMVCPELKIPMPTLN